MRSTERDWLGFEPRDAPAAEIEQLLRVHPLAHVEAVRWLSERGGEFDPDTPVSLGSWDAALHAAGGACALAESLLAGGERVGFAALRPPGHHAEPQPCHGVLPVLERGRGRPPRASPRSAPSAS